MPGYRLIRLRAPSVAAEAKPGQFIAVRCGAKSILRRPFSVHRIETGEEFSIIFAVVGSGTKWLSQCQKGETLDILGPLGNGFSIPGPSKKLLLAAGGIGIAPLVFLSQKAVADNKLVKLLLGARTKKFLYPLQLLPDKLDTVVTTEDGSQGIKGRLTDIFHEYVDWADEIYACGPIDMYRVIAEQSGEKQYFHKIQVSLEVRFGCAIGACLGCSVKTSSGMKKVCLDGPVFNLDEVMLEEVRI